MTGVEPDDLLAHRDRCRLPAQRGSGAGHEDLGFGATLAGIAAAATVLLLPLADSVDVVSAFVARCLSIARTLVALSQSLSA